MTSSIPLVTSPEWPVFRLAARSWAGYLLALGDGSPEAIAEAEATYRDAYGTSSRMTGIWHTARQAYRDAVAAGDARRNDVKES